MGNKRNRNKPQPEESPNLKAKIVDDLRKSGFDPDSMKEFELALLIQIGAAKNEIVDAIDELGAMLEDVLAPEDTEVTR
jgi:hypothetical protein